MSFDRKYLFLLASTREPSTSGNSDWLARKAAQAQRPNTPQIWMHLARMRLAPFVDQRHTIGSYPMPQGELHRMLQANLQATDLVLVAPVYWYSFPSPLKTYLDHWRAWLRLPLPRLVLLAHCASDHKNWL